MEIESVNKRAPFWREGTWLVVVEFALVVTIFAGRH